MVAFKVAIIRTYLVSLLTKLWSYKHRVNDFIMQDLSIESCCVLSSAFMTLCGVCMAIVLLVAIGFALDEIDIEYAARALTSF